MTASENTGRSCWVVETEAIKQLAAIDARLATIHTDLARIANYVDEHSRRLGTIEGNCAAHQAISIGRTRTEMSLEERINTTDGRVKDLETSRDELTGMQVDARLNSMDNRLGVVEGIVSQTKGGLSTFVAAVQTGLTILALLVSIYAISAGHSPVEHLPTPDRQHQVVK